MPELQETNLPFLKGPETWWIALLVVLLSLCQIFSTSILSRILKLIDSNVDLIFHSNKEKEPSILIHNSNMDVKTSNKTDSEIKLDKRHSDIIQYKTSYKILYFKLLLCFIMPVSVNMLEFCDPSLDRKHFVDTEPIF